MTRKRTVTVVGALLACLALANPAHAEIHYVKAGATGNGTSWTDASGDLRATLLASQEYDEVWVAAGTYTPSSNPAYYFPLPNRVTVKGGYYANPQNPGDRDENPATNGTVLSGNLGGTSHSNTIVLANGVDDQYNTRLDGFTITGAAVHAILCSDSRPTLRNLLIRNNEAANSPGAGLYVEAPIATAAPQVQFCTFWANAASGDGGAINSGANCDPTFEDSLFVANETANGDGGAVRCAGGSATFRRCTFVNNHAWNAGIFSLGGGAVYAESTVLTLRDCLFQGNIAAKSGGAVYCWGDVPGTNTELTIVTSRITDNMAYYGSGGGLYLDSAAAELVNVAFVGNVASLDGGGLFVREVFEDPASFPAYLTNCLIDGNRADYGGGLYYEYNDDTTPPLSMLVNCTIVDNYAVTWTGGAALVCAYGDPWENSGPEVTNTVIWGNHDDDEPLESTQISWDYWHGKPDATYTCIQNIQVLDGQSNIGDDPDDDDPDFVQPEQGNYTLGSTSPCRNAALNGAVPADFADLDDDHNTGEPTPLDLAMLGRFKGSGGCVDMGAYEHQALQNDCNRNGIEDATDILNQTSADCNNNDIPDECDIASGYSRDCNGNGTPDECGAENLTPDCNGNCLKDSDDIQSGYSADANGNDTPDECEYAAAGFWTDNADFDHGTAINVNHVAQSGALQRNPVAETVVQSVTIPGTRPLPYIWVAASGRGSVVRINTDTGAVEGEYWTTPQNITSSPSRTTVDLDGNAWVANRYDTWWTSGPSPQAQGSVAKFGLVIGGQRVNASGQDDPQGEYLKSTKDYPFDYCTCEDRDHDGLIHTSRGLGDLLAWTDSSYEDADGGVVTTEDECILRFLRTADTGVRTIAIDPQNDVWIGGYDNQRHEKRNGEDTNGLMKGPLQAPKIDGQFYPSGGYGGLVAQAFDGQGNPHEFLWSAKGGCGLLRLDTVLLNATGNLSNYYPRTIGDYGLGFDPRTARIWHSGNLWGTTLYEIDPWSGTAVFTYDQDFGYPAVPGAAKGVAVDNNGDVWLAESDGDEILRYRAPDPWYANVRHQDPVRITGFNGTTGVAIDRAGNVWITENNANRVSRYNRLTETVDLRVDLGFSAAPYNYSDMGGLVGLHTSGTGTWSVVHDSRHPGTGWCQVRWNEYGCPSQPSGTSLQVDVRADDHVTELAALPYHNVLSSGAALGSITGRFIQVRVRFHGTYPRPGVTSATPSLCDLTVVPLATCTKGDVNLDSLVDGRDIQPFVNVLLGNLTPIGPATLCAADMDYSGFVDLNDVPCFVELLVRGWSSCNDPCGEKSSGQPNGDCNLNSIPDANDIFNATSQDCNHNWVPDECDIDPNDPDENEVVSNDLNENGVPDECEPDCNSNGVPDDLDIADETSNDVNGNDIPDECEPDCNSNGVPDAWDISQSTSADCNENGQPDECDIALGPPWGSLDCNDNDIPDECDIANCSENDPNCQDCNENGFPDSCDIAAEISLDEDEDGIPDECEGENLLGGGGGMMQGEQWFGDGDLLFGDDPEAYCAAWDEYFDWVMQQGWGPNSNASGAEQFRAMVDKLRDLGLPVQDPWMPR